MSDHSSELDKEPRVLELLSTDVDSFEKLEVLVLIGRQPGRLFTSTEAAQELRLRQEPVEEALAELTRRGLLAREGKAFRLAKEADLIARLVELYENEKVAVLNFISKRALSRVRRAIPEAFARAFRLRGGGSDDEGNDG